MANKSNLKHKRVKQLSKLEFIDLLIKKGLKAIEKGEIKVTIADWIRLDQLGEKLYPSAPIPKQARWIDG